MTRLTATSLPGWREAQLARQGGNCALCRHPIREGACADHDHGTGHIRAILHRGCNALLGKLENNRTRNGLRDPVQFARFLSNVASYLTQDYSGHPIYPTHRTPDEKRVARNAKARKTRAAKKVT